MIYQTQYILKNQLRQELLILVPFFSINTMVIFGYVLLGAKPLEGVILVITIFLLIVNVLVVALLQTQYILVNKNTTVIIDLESRLITIKKSKSKFEYKMSEIDSLNYYASSGHISKRGPSEYYPFDSYRFFKLQFKDGKKIFITCLMMNKIEAQFENILGKEAEWHFRVFPFIY